jgi:hypothetical protein
VERWSGLNDNPHQDAWQSTDSVVGMLREFTDQAGQMRP